MKHLFKTSEQLKPHWLATAGKYADDGFGNKLRENKPARAGFIFENAFDSSYGYGKDGKK